jgi:hypothetical protein
MVQVSETLGQITDVGDDIHEACCPSYTDNGGCPGRMIQLQPK